MMTSSSPRFLIRCCQLGLALLVMQSLWAQGLRAPTQGGALRPSPSQLPPALIPVPVAQRQSSDFIVAVVGSEPITNLEVSVRAQAIEAQLRQQGQRAPLREQLLREVLDQLIQEKAQLQWAQEIGVQVALERHRLHALQGRRSGFVGPHAGLDGRQRGDAGHAMEHARGTDPPLVGACPLAARRVEDQLDAAVDEVVEEVRVPLLELLHRLHRDPHRGEGPRRARSEEHTS